MAKNYAQRKEMARNEAINWQMDFANQNYSYSELVEFSSYFEKLGKRFGLTKQFKENGII